LHILINNAAIQSSTPWLELTPAEIEAQWRANMLAPVLLCQLAVPVFRNQKWGRILNIGSVQGKVGNVGMLPYSISKAGLENLTRALSRELASDGITANMIAPGYFNTYRNRDDFKTPQDLVERSKWVPAGRLGDPQDIAGLALLLCSDAGSYITGETIYLDGGISKK
jgi:glucose 1-dehydrogenase